MSTTLYADTANVVEALKEADVQASFDSAVTVRVHDCEAVLRGETADDVEDRNLFGHLGEEVCSFEYDGAELTLRFHESQVEGELRLSPAGTGAAGPANQATGPKSLAPVVGEVLRSVEREWDVVSYDFVEVSAASMATGGHFTDFEFEYVVTSTQI